MDINQDEIRRQLRAADREQREGLTKWRDALARVFHDKSIPSEAKAELLGVQRRQFMKVGGGLVVGGAVLAACSSDKKSSTDTTVPGATDTSGSSAGSTDAADSSGGDAAGAQMDLVLARTAVSLELLAVAAYETAIAAPIQYAPAVASAAMLFKDQHQQHADAINGIISQAGGQEVTQPNAYLNENVVQPAVPGLTDQAAVLKFAQKLEATAASTYAFAGGVLSKPELRQNLAGIGGVEQRHFVVLTLALDPTDAAGANPRPFTNTEVGTESEPGRVPDEALLT